MFTSRLVGLNKPSITLKCMSDSEVRLWELATKSWEATGSTNKRQLGETHQSAPLRDKRINSLTSGLFTNLRVSSSSSEVGPPKNLLTSDVTDGSFVASWTAAPGNVRSYQIKWKSMFSEESGQMTVPGHITTAVLDGLSPETLFQVSVVANYEGGDSRALTGQETTDGTKTFPLLFYCC